MGRMLQQHGSDTEAALTVWEKEMRPFIRKPRLPVHFKGQIFVPSSRIAAALRSLLLKFLACLLLLDDVAGMPDVRGRAALPGRLTAMRCPSVLKTRS